METRGERGAETLNLTFNMNRITKPIEKNSNAGLAEAYGLPPERPRRRPRNGVEAKEEE